MQLRRRRAPRPLPTQCAKCWYPPMREPHSDSGREEGVGIGGSGGGVGTRSAPGRAMRFSPALTW
eukprot:scaffold304105_cov32-Tisochrysis_lutea.AAC.1